MKVVILAGGSGKRLWPLSRAKFPKQFLKLGGEETLLRKTLKRHLQAVSSEEIYIVTQEEHLHETCEEAKELHPSQILCEPERKNTAAAILFALKSLAERGVSEEEMILITPSDHLLSPDDTYCKALLEAEKEVINGHIVLFGIKPNYPETGYGYIKADKGSVEAFVEKPTLEVATHFLLSENYYWNSGIFAFSMKRMREELTASGFPTELSLQELVAAFSTLPSISIDYAVMEKSRHLFMIPLHLTWSDVGSWEKVFDLMKKDEKRNAFMGPVEAINTENSLILAERRLVSTIGVKDLIVIDTEDALLIAHLGEGQKVRELVDRLQEKKCKEAEEHLTVHRPWGSFTVLQEKERYKIKKIEVKPNQKLSLQLHYHRSEHWVVVKGSAKVVIGDQEKIVKEQESIFVPKTAIHRIENPGKVTLEIIEVQVGEYLGEDDIIRLEDVYGRLKEEAAFSLLRTVSQK